MIYGTIICLGDSLTSGARDEYGRGWPYELEQLLWIKYSQIWCCVNAGVPKETSIEIYSRAYDVMKKYQEATELVLLCGTNDASSQIAVPSSKFIEHVVSILNYCKIWGLPSYVCTIPAPKGFGNQDSYVPGLIDSYNNEIKKLDACIIPLEVPEHCYADGAHLNNGGSKYVAGEVMNAIEKRRYYK